MGFRITLSEEFLIWLNRNKRTFTVDTDNYNNRTYKKGSFTFTELNCDTVMIFGSNVSYKAESVTELIRFVEGIRE
jgi:hypothetical protein